MVHVHWCYRLQDLPGAVQRAKLQNGQDAHETVELPPVKFQHQTRVFLGMWWDKHSSSLQPYVGEVEPLLIKRWVTPARMLESLVLCTSNLYLLAPQCSALTLPLRILCCCRVCKMRVQTNKVRILVVLLVAPRRPHDCIQRTVFP